MVSFSPNKFKDSIEQRYKNRVKGYVIFLANKEGQVPAAISGGAAQAPGDGNIPMKVPSFHNIGSVSKMLSGIALLHLFDRHSLGDSVQEQLDLPVWKQLPPKWHNEIPEINKTITYRDLLQHKSGFHPFKSIPQELQDQFNQIKMFFTWTRDERKIPEDGKIKRKYSNHHFALLTYLIPAIAFPQEYQNCHNQFEHLDIIEYTRRMRIATGTLFERYMKDVIFPKSNIKPSCDPENELPPDVIAKMYEDKDDSTGSIYSERERNGSCRGQGGYYITAKDLANFALHFMFSNTYIGPSTRSSLYVPTPLSENPNREIEEDQLLVWGGVVSQLPDEGSDSFEEETGRRYWQYHGGHQGFDGGVTNAALISLPHDHIGVGFVNSNERGSQTIAIDILRSFFRATRPDPGGTIVPPH